jgi:hypothetical protein
MVLLLPLGRLTLDSANPMSANDVDTPPAQDRSRQDAKDDSAQSV